MKKNIIPDPMIYSNAKDYFTAFIRENKVQDSKFSYRYIAKKLKWPLAYLSDVVAGRKVLTLTRAIQFSNAYEFTSLNQERMICFALVESENPDVKSFYHKKLNNGETV